MTANQKERIQKLVQVCKQKAIPILHKICEYSLIVLRIVVGCVAVFGELLFAFSKFLFSRFMELPVRIRAISAGAVALGVVVFLLWPKGRAENDDSARGRTSENALAQFNGVAKNMNSGVITHDNSQINHGENMISSSQHSRNSLSQFNGVAKSMNSGRMVQGNHGVSGVVKGSSGSNRGFANYNKNDIAAEYLGSGIPGTRYYNPYYESYRPLGTYFGGCGNPYGEWHPNTNIAYPFSMNWPNRKFKNDEEYRAWVKSFEESERNRKMLREMEHIKHQIRHSRAEGELAALKLEDDMRKTQNDLNDIKRDDMFLGMGIERNTQQQEVMDKYNLEQLHPEGWMPQYGANPGDSHHFIDKEKKLHRVEYDGTHYEFDERAKVWYKVD